MSLRDGANFAPLRFVFVYAFFFLRKYLIMRCFLSSQGCGPQCCELCSKKTQLADFLYKLQAIIRVCESVFVSLFGVWWYCAVGGEWAQWKNTGGLKKKHKKQPFSDASASHLSLVLWHV